LQIPRAGAAIAPGQITQPSVTAPQASGVAVPSVTAPQSRSGAASINEVQGRIDLCERIIVRQAPPIPGLDCSADALAALRNQQSALAPPPPVQTNNLNNTIDSIGRSPDAINTNNGVPPIVILQH
jgi:hypothetical protein